MRPRTRLLAGGIATLLAGLCLLFPARVAYDWFAPPGVALAGIDGTVWRGRASEADVSGVYLRNLEWRVRPLALLGGTLALSVTADTAGGFVESDVGLGTGGRIALSDTRAALSLQSLQDALAMPGLAGKLNARFERVEVRDGLPVAAVGIVEVEDLLAPLVDRGPLGGYRAEFFTQESGVLASVEDTDGLVDLAGSLQISSDRTIQFIAQIAAKNTTPAHLREQMKFLGTPNSRGQYELRLEGRL